MFVAPRGKRRAPKSLLLGVRNFVIILNLLGWAPVVVAQSQQDEGNAALAAPLRLAEVQIKSEFKKAGAGKEASAGISAVIKGDVVTVRRVRDALGIDDKARVAMGALEVLADPQQDTIEPYTRVKYTFMVDRESHAMISTPDSRPTNKLIEKLKLELQFQPDAAALTGQAIHYGLATQLLRTAAARDGSVVLADDVLFSRGRDPYLMERPPFSGQGSWTLLSFNQTVSDKYNHLPYSVFLQTLIAQAKSTPVFSGGLWHDLLPYAENLSPGSQKAWGPVYVSVAEGFEGKRRYASGAFIRIVAANQKVDDCYPILLAALKSFPANDIAANRNIAIAYGYLVEMQVHFGKNVVTDRADHRDITTILASRLNEREMKNVIATRTAPRYPE